MSVPKGSKPTIIGLYGISGSGRPYLSNKLRIDTTLKALGFAFHDGSNLLDQVAPGGLVKFKQLESASKLQYWEAVLAKVSQDCQDHGQTAVIAGHYLLWNAETEPKGLVVGIEKDWRTYTHIIYLNTDPVVIVHRIKTGTHRKRPVTSVEDLYEWQDQERHSLREICCERGILFTTLSSDTFSSTKRSQTT
jgi:adenylate kinase